MANGPITITDTTTNSGTTAMPASVTGFYLSLNTSHDATDIFLGEPCRGSSRRASADSGSTQMVIPAGTAIRQLFRPRHRGLEPRGAGNQRNATTSKPSATLRVGPDVTVTAVTGPSSAVAGTSITGRGHDQKRWRRHDAGVGDEPLPVDELYARRDRRAPGQPAGSVACARGQRDRISVGLLIPATTTGGTYYIIAKADGPNATVEPQENNNTRLKSISITAAP